MSHRLLPTSATAEAPAFEVSVRPDVHQLLARNSLRLKLVIKDGQYSLKAGSTVLPLDLATTPTAEVFKHLSQSTLKGIGAFSGRLHISSPPVSPASTASAASSVSDKAAKRPSPPPPQVARTSPTIPTGPASSSSSSTSAHAKPHTLVASGTKINHITKRIVHLLALGPITRTDLTRRAKLTANEVDAVLKSVSMVYSPREKQLVPMDYPHIRAANDTTKESLYVLNYSSYKDLKLGEWKYRENELKKIKHNCQLAFNHLKYPSTHPAWDKLESKSDDDKETQKEVKKEVKKEIKNKEETPRIKKGTPSPPSTTATTTSTNSKKRPHGQDDAFLHDLAERFQVTYKEYERLYKAINDKKQRDQEEVKKLFDMHRNLESWKKQLWSSVATE